MVWKKPVRKRWVRRRQSRRNVIVSALRDRRTASVTATTTGEFDGYAIELLTAVAGMLGIHFEFYAVPPRISPSALDRTHDYGIWSSLVDQLLTEASLDISDFLSVFLLSFKFFSCYCSVLSAR